MSGVPFVCLVFYRTAITTNIRDLPESINSIIKCMARYYNYNLCISSYLCFTIQYFQKEILHCINSTTTLTAVLTLQIKIPIKNHDHFIECDALDEIKLPNNIYNCKNLHHLQKLH